MDLSRKFKCVSLGLVLFVASLSPVYFILLEQSHRLLPLGSAPSVTPYPELRHFIPNDDGGNASRLRVEDLDAYVTKESITNYLRPSTSFRQASAVEMDRRGRLAAPLKEDEEFTIVVLTYKRTDIMLKLLQHLSGLPSLNQVLLIWNSEELPGSNLKWPNVSYPIRLLTNRRNTLHNRFLPLSIIETEGVFILDDDTFLLHEKVLEAFHVWQAHRDQIVGFTGRGVRWITNKDGTGSWKYRQRVTPESISLVLMGNAFIHWKFMELYTYRMPSAMREIIDMQMNCEDIAFNFLVADTIQKPPIWIRHPLGILTPCDEKPCTGLSTRKEHYKNRSKCLNQFSKILGYNPLLKQGHVTDCLTANTSAQDQASVIVNDHAPSPSGSTKRQRKFQVVESKKKWKGNEPSSVR